MINLEEQILELERRTSSTIPGTILQRVLGEKGPVWALGVGRLGDSKEFGYGDTIEAAIKDIHSRLDKLGVPRVK